MTACDTCGNEYDKCFEIVKDGRQYVFDCFECAIHKLAPSCERCGCLVIGHGAENAGRIFCSASCARAGGTAALVDRTG